MSSSSFEDPQPTQEGVAFLPGAAAKAKALAEFFERGPHTERAEVERGESIARALTRGEVVQALRELPWKQQVCLTAWLAEEPVAATAQRHDWSEADVRVTCYRAKRNLQDVLNRHGVLDTVQEATEFELQMAAGSLHAPPLFLPLPQGSGTTTHEAASVIAKKAIEFREKSFSQLIADHDAIELKLIESLRRLVVSKLLDAGYRQQEGFIFESGSSRLRASLDFASGTRSLIVRVAETIQPVGSTVVAVPPVELRLFGLIREIAFHFPAKLGFLHGVLDALRQRVETTYAALESVFIEKALEISAFRSIYDRLTARLGADLARGLRLYVTDHVEGFYCLDKAALLDAIDWLKEADSDRSPFELTVSLMTCPGPFDKTLGRQAWLGQQPKTEDWLKALYRSVRLFDTEVLLDHSANSVFTLNEKPKRGFLLFFMCPPERQPEVYRKIQEDHIALEQLFERGLDGWSPYVTRVRDVGSSFEQELLSAQRLLGIGTTPTTGGIVRAALAVPALQLGGHRKPDDSRDLGPVGQATQDATFAGLLPRSGSDLRLLNRMLLSDIRNNRPDQRREPVKGPVQTISPSSDVHRVISAAEEAKLTPADLEHLIAFFSERLNGLALKRKTLLRLPKNPIRLSEEVLLLGHVEQLILKSIRLIAERGQKSAFSESVQETLEVFYGHRVSAQAVRAMLVRLRSKGLLSSNPERSPHRGRPREVYVLTDAGALVLEP